MKRTHHQAFGQDRCPIWHGDFINLTGLEHTVMTRRDFECQPQTDREGELA